ncbi:unnamed protein product, partial [Symbiodinium natans]
LPMPSMRMGHALFRLMLALLLSTCGAGAAEPEMDYALLRANVVQAYAQQTAEMAETLNVLQSLSVDTAATLARLESACLWRVLPRSSEFCITLTPTGVSSSGVAGIIGTEIDGCQKSAAVNMVRGPCVLVLVLQAAAQQFAPFDAATASSTYSSKTFGADLATSESSGYWCSAGDHEPGQSVSWTGVFKARRQLLGVTLRWSYAPEEVKVLTSSDGGNFQESVGWRKLSRPEPSFEDTILFPEPVAAKAVKVLMRGAKPWGYFGLSNAVAIARPSAFMLVSGVPAAQEQCVVASSSGVAAKPCIDAVVSGTGAEIFAGAGGELQVLGGGCLGVVAGKLSLIECQAGQGSWVVAQDGQVKQGNTCLVVTGAQVSVADCDDAALTGGDKFFQVAVPDNDPAAVVAVQEVGALLRASVKRQRALVAALQRLVPRLDSCKPQTTSLAVKQNWPAFLQSGSSSRRADGESLTAKVGASFGPGSAELDTVLAASADVLRLAGAKLPMPSMRMGHALFRLMLALLLSTSGAGAAEPEMDYALLRANVVQAYAQQTAEMAETLNVLQSLSTDTAATLARLESACRCVLVLVLQAAAQQFAPFDAATASSTYSSKTFGADLATSESSGYWCSAGDHEPGQSVSWTGVFKARRQLLGVTLRWSYAPEEVKVLTSSDGGNFQESVGWRKLSRPEPSFEDTILFPEPVAAKAVKVLMRGAKPWGYFGLSNAVAIARPSAFMLVSGVPAAQEQCVVASSSGVAAKPCVDAVVSGTGAEIFAGAGGELQVLGGGCLGVVAGKLSLIECQAGQGSWVVAQDGQVKQGNTCLVVTGAQVSVADCDDAALTGGDKFFQVAVPDHDPAAVVAVQEVGALLRASVKRQRALVAALQRLVPRLDSCKPQTTSLAVKQNWPAFLQSGSSSRRADGESLTAKVGASFGPGGAELDAVLAASADVLRLVGAKLPMPSMRMGHALFRLMLALLLSTCGAGAAEPEMDYALLRANVVQAYAQQTAEMAETLNVLQSLSADTAATLARLESACAE